MSSGWGMRDIEAGWRCVEDLCVSFSGPLPMYINTKGIHELSHELRMKNERYRGRVEMRWRSGWGSGRAAWECYQSPVVSNNLIIPTPLQIRNICYRIREIHVTNLRNTCIIIREIHKTQMISEKYTLRDLIVARCVRVLSEPGRDQQFDNSNPPLLPFHTRQFFSADICFHASSAYNVSAIGFIEEQQLFCLYLCSVCMIKGE